MKLTVGIDAGSSAAKIAVTYAEGGKARFLPSLRTLWNDPEAPIGSILEKHLAANGFALPDVGSVRLTGTGAAHLMPKLSHLPCRILSEFDCIGKGARFLTGEEHILVASVGTGTAMVFADGDKAVYLGGTGVGGGTLVGLSDLLLGTKDIPTFESLLKAGSHAGVDLMLGDFPELFASMQPKDDMTVSNFAKANKTASPEDTAAGIANLVYEVTAMMSVFAAKSVGVRNIAVIGKPTETAGFCEKYAEIEGMGFGIHFIIPENAAFATAIGAALL